MNRGEAGYTAVRAVVDTLPEREFAVVVLFGLGMSYEEIGRAFDVSRERARDIRLTAKKRMDALADLASLA